MSEQEREHWRREVARMEHFCNRAGCKACELNTRQAMERNRAVVDLEAQWWMWN